MTPSFLFALFALCLHVACAAAGRFASEKAANKLFLAGWMAMGAAVGLAVFASNPDRGARLGFASSLCFAAWIAIALHSHEMKYAPDRLGRLALSLFAAISCALLAGFPGEAWVASDTPKSPIHWALGITSYGLFAAAVLHAALLDSAEKNLRHAEPGSQPMPLLKIERLAFRFVFAGFVALTLSIGVGFSEPQWSWGDRKTVLALMGWLTFASLLAGRTLRGWRGRQATRWIYAGATLLLLAYAGSRFVLEAILHRAIP